MLCFTSMLGLAQTQKIKFLSQIKPIMVNKIRVLESDTLMFIKFDFAEDELLKIEKMARLTGRTILRIDLVYTTYVESSTFNQYLLNYNRFKKLLETAPYLATEEQIEWRIYGSTGWKNENDAKKLFCGFVFHLRPLPTKIESEKEIEQIKRSLYPEIYGSVDKMGVKTYGGSYFKRSKTKIRTKATNVVSKCLTCYEWDSVNSEVKTSNNYTKAHAKIRKHPRYKTGEPAFYQYLFQSLAFRPNKNLMKTKNSTGIYSFIMDQTGIMADIRVEGSDNTPELDSLVINQLENMPQWSMGNTRGVLLKYNFVMSFSTKKHKVKYHPKKQYIDINHLTICQIIDTSKVITEEPPEIVFDDFYFLTVDTTVTAVFKRNQQWKKMLVVADLTGSMAPYTQQLLVWFKLGVQTKSLNIKHLTFFNDGDATPDRDKKIGATGGIYHADIMDNNFKIVENLAFQTMRGGSGGDGPENNLEAMIEGINACKDCEQVVMIADNYATPRDLELLYHIERPVKLILCGTSHGINTKYLDFVRKNKGSLHIIEEDILQLMNLNEGGSIEINGIEYQIKRGYFYRVY